MVSVPIILHWVELIEKAYSTPKKGSQTETVYGLCQDNCISALGKILKKFNKNIDLRFLQ